MFGFRNGKGAVVVDGQHVADTVQCVHCGYTWQIIPGSGKKRGWCNDCAGVVCGDAYCMSNCTPFEARVELTEAIAEKNRKKAIKIVAKYPNIAPI